MSAASHFFGGSNSEVPLRVLVVAGGGGSGGWSVSFPSSHNVGGPSGVGLSGCGGGGTVQEIRSYPGKSGRTYNITVGAGGTAGIATDGTDSATAVAYRGGKGEDSVFADPLGDTFTAEGGGGGGAGYTQNPGAPWTGIPYALKPSEGGNQELMYGAPGGSGGSGAINERMGNAEPQQINAGEAGNAFSNLGVKFDSGPGTRYTEDKLIQTRYGTYGGFPATTRDPGGSYGNRQHTMSGGAGRRDWGTYDAEYQLAPTAPAETQELVLGNGYKSNIEGTIKSYGAGRYSNRNPVSSGTVYVEFQNPNVPVGPNRNPDWANYAPVPNTGHGAYGVTGYPNNQASASYRWEGPGAVGSSGVVIVQYSSSFGNATTTGTVTDISSNTPGYKTYKFTTDGTIQLP